MNRPKIISLGEVLWDLFAEGDRFGGAPANFACHAAILGGDVSMLSAVGDDDRGREAMRILQGYGIDVSLMQVSPDAPTGTVGVTLDANRKPTFTIHKGSAWDGIAWNDEIESHVSKADAVYFGTLGQRGEVSQTTIRRVVEGAGAAGLPRVLDVNLRPPFYDDALIRTSIEMASILKLSDDELPEVCAACGIPSSDPPEARLRKLLETEGLDLVVMTRGAKGALLATSDGLLNQPGEPTTVRDTVGAGDSFTAAFVLGLLRGQSHDQILQKACATAAATCSHIGAVPGHPE